MFSEEDDVREETAMFGEDEYFGILSLKQSSQVESSYWIKLVHRGLSDEFVSQFKFAVFQRIIN